MKDAIDHDGAYHATRSRSESEVRERVQRCRVECRRSCSTIRDGYVSTFLFDNSRAFQSEVSLYQMIQNSLNGSGRSPPDLCQSSYTRGHRVAYTKMRSFSIGRIGLMHLATVAPHLTVSRKRKRSVKHCVISRTARKRFGILWFTPIGSSKSSRDLEGEIYLGASVCDIF